MKKLLALAPLGAVILFLAATTASPALAGDNLLACLSPDQNGVIPQDRTLEPNCPPGWTETPPTTSTTQETAATSTTSNNYTGTAPSVTAPPVAKSTQPTTPELATTGRDTNSLVLAGAIGLVLGILLILAAMLLERHKANKWWDQR